MPRRPRDDSPGTIHHVVNRGLNKRTMFETRRDKRKFLSLVARAVRRGEIRVLAFTILTTHYHLLVVSVGGQLDRAMRRIQVAYTRYFNGSRDRVGPLVGSRYFSRVVKTAEYFSTVVVYIDANAVDAGLSATAELYEHASARFRAHAKRPPWFTSDEPYPCETVAVNRERFSALRHVVEGRLGRRDEDDDDWLLRTTPSQVVQWMHRRARAGDGSRPGLPTSDPTTVIRAIDQHARELSAFQRSGRCTSMTNCMKVSLLHELCGLGFRKIGDLIGRPMSTCAHANATHRRLVLSDEKYTRLAARIACEAIRNGALGREGWTDVPGTDVSLEGA